MRPRRAAEHSPLSSAAVMVEQNHTSTHSLGYTGPVTRITLPLPFYLNVDVEPSLLVNPVVSCTTRTE